MRFDERGLLPVAEFTRIPLLPHSQIRNPKSQIPNLKSQMAHFPFSASECTHLGAILSWNRVKAIMIANRTHASSYA